MSTQPVLSDQLLEAFYRYCKDNDLDHDSKKHPLAFLATAEVTERGSAWDQSSASRNGQSGSKTHLDYFEDFLHRKAGEDGWPYELTAEYFCRSDKNGRSAFYKGLQ